MRKRFMTDLADALTSARIFISILLPILGIMKGREGLSQAIMLVLIAWLTDVFDGPCARRGNPTRLGKYDFAIDVIMTFSTLMYLALAGFVPLQLAIAYLGIGLIITILAKRKAIVIMFMRPIDVLGGVVALTYAPQQAFILIFCLAGVLMMRWQRFLTGVRLWLGDLLRLLIPPAKK